MENVEAITKKLQTIRELGVEIAIDDFGTGYSSLAYIARLPIHDLKIDRSFVVGMTESKDSLAIVKSVISLAHSLRLRWFGGCRNRRAGGAAPEAGLRRDAGLPVSPRCRRTRFPNFFPGTWRRYPPGPPPLTRIPSGPLLGEDAGERLQTCFRQTIGAQSDR